MALSLRKSYAAIAALCGLIALNGGCGDEGEDGTLPPTADVPSDSKVVDSILPPPPTKCTNNDQCAAMEGADACRLPICDLTLSQCALFQKPNCCVADEECDDQDPNTTDTCEADLGGICTHADEGTPCQTDLDCVTNQPCVTFACDEYCTWWQKPGCCTGDADCDDGDLCTEDLCTNFACLHEASNAPQCCGDSLLQSAFTDGVPDGWDIDTNGQPVVWHATQERVHSEGGAIRFGNPNDLTYQNPKSSDNTVAASQGTLIMPPVALGSEPATLSFWLWLDIESVADYDELRIDALTDMSSIPVVWDKSALADTAPPDDPEANYRTWVPVTVDLGLGLANQTVRFAFVVDTKDGTVNQGEGVYLDDVAVVAGCSEPPGCGSAADCDDGDPCTQDVCLDDGTCMNEGTGQCCVSNADCADTNPCTEDSCTADGQCVSVLIPECCEPVEEYGTTFPSGDDGGVEIENDQDAGGWGVDDMDSHSAPRALHYGDPATGTYELGGASSGTARLPLVSLPPGEPSELRFWLRADIEEFENADVLNVRVRAGEGAPAQVVWSKDQLALDQFDQWVPVVVDLSPWGGAEKVRVSFHFDTVDPLNNTGQGVFIDDIQIGWGCGAQPCTPANCDDGDPCTDDLCDASGQCYYVPSADPSCSPNCVIDEDCPSDDPCLDGFCLPSGDCAYTPDPNCECGDVVDCNDGNDCTADFCFQGKCENVPIPGCAQPCGDDGECSDNDPCTLDLCADDGTCVHIPDPECGGCIDAVDCNDGNDCTADFCFQGKCESVPIPGCGTDCNGDFDCQDTDPCTIDSCGDDGQCYHTPDPDCGGCQGPADCNDGNDCTADFCFQGLCESVLIPGCGNECTSNAQCADGDQCTIDICGADGQCAHLPNPECGCNSPSDCNDGNDCTADFCQNGQCVSLPIPGCVEACTGDTDCADDDPCTLDLCDAASGECLHIPDPVCGGCTGPADCNDGDDCTADFCQNGQCVNVDIPGCGPECQSNFECQDNDPCTDDFCTQQGTCQHAAIPGCGGACQTAQDCADGLDCTTDVCAGGQCQNIVDPDCAVCEAGVVFADNFDTATGNSTGWEMSPANEGVGWQILAFDYNTSPPSSLYYGNPEALNYDSGGGNSGSAVSKPFIVGVGGQLNITFQVIADVEQGQSYDQLRLMAQLGAGQQVELWSKGSFGQVGPEFQQVSVSSAQLGGSSVRLEWRFETVDGLFNDTLGVVVDDVVVTQACGDACFGVNCNDFNPCTSDTCQDGQCIYSPVPGCCQAANQCDDSKACTTDLCVQNQCVNLQIPGCGDPDCMEPADCEDGDPCTNNSCANGQCVSSSILGCCKADSECLDSDPCSSDECVDNECLNLPIPSCGCTTAQCNDGNVCTLDGCTADGDCIYQQIPGCCTSASQCADDDPCTVDLCAANACEHLPNPACECTPDTCDDGNPCTIDQCTSDGQCLNTLMPNCCWLNSQCNDGDQCTKDACSNGTCVHEPDPACACTPEGCDDNNPCTADGCDAAGQCVHKTKPSCCQDDSQCGDADPCTVDVCLNNVCVHAPDPGCACTDESCDDNNPCTSDGCVAGQCVNKPLPDCCLTNSECNDADQCTLDACTNNKCVHTPDPTCACTPESCDDNNPCTADGCGAAGVCVHKPLPGCCLVDSQCADDSPCTVDSCVGNVCVHQAEEGCCLTDAQCEDGDDCTINSCVNNLCQSKVDPLCCTPTKLAATEFSAEPGGWTVESNGLATWQLGSLQSHTAPTSYWFGNAKTGNIENEGQSSAGTATSGALALPAGEYVLMTSWVFLDVEVTPGFDQFEIRVVTAAEPEGALVWSKTALSPNQFGTWAQIKVNLTAFAGQTIRLRYTFDSIDPINNEGQGIFIDDLWIGTSCEPLDDVCVFDGECSDGDQCTADSCSNGQCQHNEIDGCCQSDAECNDNYACTTDFCGENGQCQHAEKEGCCVFNGECDDDNPCTQDLCINNQCMWEPGGEGCCFADDQCDDGDPCTKSWCEDFQCQYAADTGPNCCAPALLLGADFDDATSQGFSFIQDGSEAKWSVQLKRAFSDPFSLYFGVPGEWTTETQPPSSGVAISPPLTVPLTAASVTLSFQTWMDLLNFQNFGDIYNVKVLQGTTLKTHWSREDAGPGAEGQWVQATVDLSEYKGDTIQIYWNFQSVNSPFGQPGEGVYVDDINVFTGCQ